MTSQVSTPKHDQPSTVVGRLAPSPTGALHLGNARSFLLAWLSARSQHGKVLLRIEDIDSPRVKPWAKEATIEDLDWLGLDWDEGPKPSDSNSDSSDYIQTNRLARYQRVVRHLVGAGKIYPCVCSRTDIANAQSAPHESGGQLREPLDGQVYPGTCRPRSLDLNALPDKHAWRWKFEQGTVLWHDRLLGHQELDPSRFLGDFVVAKADLAPAYQLAVVLDDHDMGVTEVVRGDDLIYSTYRQLAILEYMKFRVPNYFHVPLIVGSDGRRLAKRHGDTRLRQFRELGVAPTAIVGYLAWTLGFLAAPVPCWPSDLLQEFDWQKLALQPTTFTLEDELPKLLAMS